MEYTERDEEVAVRVQRGDVESFGVLVERYEAKMRRYARRFLFTETDTDDVVQDVFLKAYTNINSFDPSRSFSTWLYRVAHNSFINTLKKNRRLPLLFFDADSLFPHPVASEETDRDMYDQQIKDAMEHCLGELNSKYREVLVLYFIEGLRYQEIADVLHMPVSTVGVRIQRAKAALRVFYQKTYPSV